MPREAGIARANLCALTSIGAAGTRLHERSLPTHADVLPPAATARTGNTARATPGGRIATGARTAHGTTTSRSRAEPSSTKRACGRYSEERVMKQVQGAGSRISRAMVAIVGVGVALMSLNVVMIAELREEGRADRAAWKHESAQARSERERLAREIARLTRQGRHGPRRCRLTREEVENGTRCPR